LKNDECPVTSPHIKKTSMKMVQPCGRNVRKWFDDASPVGPGGVIISQTLLGPILVWSQQYYQQLLFTVW